MTCPAFQSTYILDDSLRFAYFSPLWKLDKETRDGYITKNYDGQRSEYFASVEPYVVKASSANRTKFGVARYEPNWLKAYQMRTAPRQDLIWMEEVSDDPIDSMDIGSFVASDFGLDSIAGDSVILAAQDSVPAKQYLYGYDPEGQNNVEQDYYNKYFGYLLVAKAAPSNEDSPTDSTGIANDPFLENDSLQVEKRGFLKRKKKKDETEDSDLVEEDGFEEEENEVEEENGN
tara:strand:- start:5463 stop:6158 length:696 start_codon:yes stop_codon:yes gene_type:complete